MSEPIRVLFVCTGNICRSPMSEAAFAHLVQKNGLSERFQIDSAGTHDYHVGETADPRTLRTLSAHGIPYQGRARKITRADLERFDYILAAEQVHVSEIKALGTPKGKLMRILDYALAQPLRDFPDPYYDGRFEVCYELATQAAQGFLDAVRKEWNLNPG
jgi:protein-tyrosine phosphatase